MSDVTYLDALAEIHRAVQRQPADEWETGALIRLYAEALRCEVTAAGRVDSLDGPDEFGWRRGSHEYSGLLAVIVEAAEIIIRRTFPNLVTQMTSLSLVRPDYLSGGAELKAETRTEPFNEIANQVAVDDGAAIRAVWLTSFDKPDSFSGEGGGLDPELQSRGPDAVQAFIAACADLARAILADAGPTANALTTRLADAGTHGAGR